MRAFLAPVCLPLMHILDRRIIVNNSVKIGWGRLAPTQTWLDSRLCRSDLDSVQRTHNGVWAADQTVARARFLLSLDPTLTFDGTM